MTLARSMTRDEASSITARIRDAAKATWELVTLAHEGKAHLALGYETWEAYVNAEFDMSRQRAYQLLNQGRVTRALEAVSTDVDITEAEARRAKPHLEEIVEEVKHGAAPREAIQSIPAKPTVAMSRQRRAILDLRLGSIITLPHDGYKCPPRHCALADLIYRIQKEVPEGRYISTHTEDGNFVVGYFDPNNVEDLNY